MIWCMTWTLLLAAQAEQPQLVLETGGHTAACKWVQWTPDGRRLISGGDDKVVRIWDVSDPSAPVLERSIRHQIGAGGEGTLNAGALSPDGRWLAVAGALDQPEGPRLGDVRLFELAAGRLVGTVQGHQSVVNALDWSADGLWLASASADLTVRVSDLSGLADGTLRRGNPVPTAVLAGMAAGPRRVRFLPDTADRQKWLASAGYDGVARLWRFDQSGWTVAGTLSSPPGVTTDVAVAADGRTLAVSGSDGNVRLWDTRDNSFGTLVPPQPGGSGVLPPLAFSPDGAVLNASDVDGPGAVTAWSVPDGRLLGSLQAHDNTLWAIEPAPDNAAVATVGGSGNAIRLWSSAGEPLGAIEGRGDALYAAAFSADGRRIAYGRVNEGDALQQDTPLTSAFDLAETAPLSFDPAADWRRAAQAADGYAAARDPQRQDTLVVRRNGRETCRIVRTGTNERVTSFAFLPGRRQVAVAGDFSLTLHDAESGRTLRRFVGSAGTTWALAVSPDGKTLLSVGNDQTLRLWRLEDADADAAVADQVGPLLSVFVAAGDRDWVAWTEQGYYASSPGGDQLIGWHTNRGRAEPADFTAGWQYARILKRPEVVELVLTARSTTKAVELAAQAARTRPEAVVDVRTDRDRLAVPRVRVTAPSQDTEVAGATVRLTGSVTPTGSLPILDVRVTVNKRPVESGLSRSKGLGVRGRTDAEAGDGDGDAAPVVLDLEIPLLAGANLVEVIASTAAATSQPYAVEVTRQAAAAQKPRLFVLAVGVSAYQIGELALKFPAKDVSAVAQAFKDQEGQLYREVVVDELLDEQVTERNLRRAVRDLQRGVTQHDVALMVVSGHGYAEPDGTYFFCPWDFDPEEPTVTGIRWSELTEPLASLPAKVVLCMDTCHAGGVLGPRTLRAKATFDAVQRAIGDLTGIESGVVVLTSSTGKQVSLEDDRWGHGAFALALIEAVSGRRRGPAGSITLPADLNADGMLELTEIDAYVTGRVNELTDGRQKPVTDRGRLPSFPLAVVPEDR